MFKGFRLRDMVLGIFAVICIAVIVYAVSRPFLLADSTKIAIIQQDLAETKKALSN